MSATEDDSWYWLPPGEPVKGKTYRADGWVYRDLPRMEYELFDAIKDVIGEDNIVWLALSDYGGAMRGQALLSPTGVERLRAVIDQNKIDTEKFGKSFRFRPKEPTTPTRVDGGE